MANEVEAQEATAAEVDTGSPDGQGESSKQSGDKSAQTKPGETQAERKLRLKFGKEEREVDEREAIMLAQKGWAADERFNQAARMRKEVEDAVKNGDLDKLIEMKFGKPADEWAKEKLQAKLRQMTMSPEERERYEAKQEVDRLRKEADDLKKARASEQLQKAQAFYEEQYDREISAAINAEGLPKSRAAIKRVVDIGQQLINQGLDPDWTLVTREAKRQILGELKELMAGYGKDEDLLQALGDEIPKRLGKAMSNRSSVVGRAQNARVEGDVKPKQDQKNNAVDMAAWMKAQRKKFEEG